MNEAVKQKFCQVLGKEQVLFEEPMKSHTTFRIGGPAEVFIMPKSVKQVQMAVKICQEEQIPYFILGNGSNLLVSDRGYRGVIIQMDRNMGEIQVEGTEIQAAAGALLSSIAVAARRESLTGFEFAGGIPGTLGGAVVMNAGAYGGEMKNIVKTVRLMDEEGQVVEFSNEDMNFGYRHSRLSDERWIAISAVISLEKGDKAEIKAKMEDLALQRRTKQPLEYPSAGSTFKRPTGYFAGKLIQDSDLKGVSVGGAQVSSKHSGFVINYNKASAKDIVDLIEHVKITVYECQGVHLEEEVKILGEDEE